jgi:hypothetical protein
MNFGNIKLHRKNTTARRKFEARELLDRLKNNPCSDCNGRFHPCQMDFYREDPERSLISQLLIRSQKFIISETQKCVLLCANCSRLRNYYRQRHLRSDNST